MRFLLLVCCMLIPAALGNGTTLFAELAVSTLAGSPGDTLTFQGSLANDTGANLWINGAGINLQDLDPTDVDLTGFIRNAAGLLANGSSTSMVDLFTVAIPSTVAPGVYPGLLTIQGGPTANDETMLQTLYFQVVVSSAVPASGVPEPLPVTLTGAGLLGMFLAAGWRRLRSRFGAAQQLECVISALLLIHREVDPQHGKRLQQARILERPYIHRV